MNKKGKADTATGPFASLGGCQMQYLEESRVVSESISCGKCMHDL